MTLRLWLEALGVAIVVVRVDHGREPRPKGDDRQLSLDLIGGRMNNVLVRKGFKRYPSPRLPDIAA
ncbi:MAG: hypothetical protein E5W94_04065 [Mesorhizobium sp.]|nr:MAG: hypothetical protein E5W94_04065 [Mesorhizobium sp.]